MMELSIDHGFAGNGWRDRKTGSGSVTVSGGIVTCTGAATESALMDYYVPVLPGQTVEFEVYGLLTSGTAVVALDGVDHHSDTFDAGLDSVNLSGEDWKRYRVQYTMPLKSSGQATFLRATVGVPTAPAGSAKFHSPVIRTSGGYGQPLVIAAGLLRVVDGTASMHPDYPSFGIASVERTDTDEVTVTLDHEIASSPEVVKPRVFVSATPDHFHHAVAGSVTGGETPTFLVKWSTGAAMATITSSSWFAFLRVEI